MSGGGCCLPAGTSTRLFAGTHCMCSGHVAAWASSQHGGWVPRASIPREPVVSYIIFNDLASEITGDYFTSETSWPRFKGKGHKPIHQCEHGKVTLKGEHMRWETWLQRSVENIICPKHHVYVHVKEWNCIRVAVGIDQSLTTMTNLPCEMFQMMSSWFTGKKIRFIPDFLLFASAASW